MGSMLLGSVEEIQRARRARKLFGGALRQAGMMAAAAIYALDNHVERLAEDHVNARRFAELLAEIPGVKLNPADVETNLVFFEIDPSLGTAAEFALRMRQRNVNLYGTGPQRVRACTHLDVTAAELEEAARQIRACLEGDRVAVAVPASLAY